ncbi:MAG: hypothetical protein AB1476_05260 [Candidatus Hadarchaeota archaeon]
MKEIPVPKFKDSCVLSKGMEVSELVKVRKDTVVYVQPCASEKGKLMADIELKKEEGEGIDAKTLCYLLDIHRRRFSELRCSPSLGVAKLTWKGKEISIFKSCKLKIQRAIDKEELLRVGNSVSRLVWGAAICEVCGRPALECASGSCGKCSSGTKVVQVDDIPNGVLLLKGYSELERAREIAGEREMHVRDAQYVGLFFTTEAAKKEDAVLGLVLVGEAKLAGKM